jgi:MerR family transcriptional regulator/heat shock protein HspR
MRTRQSAATANSAPAAHAAYRREVGNGNGARAFPINERSYSIGHVARMLYVSAQTIRYYEREGLILPTRTSAGTRRYTTSDLARLKRIRDLISDEGLNVAGIRHMLGMLPCWELRGCGVERASECWQLHDDRHPCWTNSYCMYRDGPKTCRACNVYLRAFDVLAGRRVLRLMPSGWPQA